MASFKKITVPIELEITAETARRCMRILSYFLEDHPDIELYIENRNLKMKTAEDSCGFCGGKLSEEKEYNGKRYRHCYGCHFDWEVDDA